MKIEKQLQDDHQVKLIVEVESERMEASMHHAARELAARGKIPGFRPGKAPYDVIRRFYGESAVKEKAIDLLVDEVYPKALDQASIKPAAPGILESVDSLEPPKLTFKVPLAPTVELGDYHSIRLPYDWKEPGDQELETAIEDLRHAYGSTETVDRAIQDGDFALVDIIGKKVMDKENGSPFIERKDYAVFIHKIAPPDEWPFIGFSEKLIGLQAGEGKNLFYEYSEDFHNEDLRGYTISFEVTVKTVRVITLPELDDEFAKMVGPIENVQALRDTLRANLTQTSMGDYDNEYITRVIDEIKKGADIKYPPQVLEEESNRVLEKLTHSLKKRGMEFDTYLKMRQLDREKFLEEEIHPQAVLGLERRLVLEEIARADKIKLDKKSLGTEFNQTWGALAANDEKFNKITKGGTKASKDLIDAVAMESANRLMTRRVLDHLKSIATGMYKETTLDEKPQKRTSAKKTGSVLKGRSTSRSKKPISQKKTNNGEITSNSPALNKKRKESKNESNEG